MTSWKVFAVAFGLSGATAAFPSIVFAQCATSNVVTNGVPQPPSLLPGADRVGNLTASTASAISSAVGNINAAFLQQGSSFVSAPGEPGPNQPGGGISVRGVGGEISTTATSTSRTSLVAPGFGRQTGDLNCASDQRQAFGGVQASHEISRLNWGGWNVHVGATAGYMSSSSNDRINAFKTNIDVPFVGGAVVGTYGGFFADLMVRGEFYLVSLHNPGLNFTNQEFGGRGFSIAASTGYRFSLPNNWFIEPSAGFIWSRTTMDSLSAVGPLGNPISGTLSIDAFSSQLGRASVRVGTDVLTPTLLLQPFFTASVFHEFAGNVTSQYSTCTSCVDVAGAAAVFTSQSTTSRVGTYGQYALSIAGRVRNTGWLGFGRVAYRHGDDIEGWTGDAGIRYEFSPDHPSSVKLPTKAAPRLVTATNWTGLYIGGFLGGGFGKADVGFSGLTTTNPTVSGGILGGQVGYNYQVNNWVFGLEGDIGVANIRGFKTCGQQNGLDATGALVGFSPFFLNCGAESNWLATATTRLGYAVDRSLFFVKGGAAWMDTETSATCIADPSGKPLGSRGCFSPSLGVIDYGISTNHSIRAGWTVGGGMEFDLGRNWSATAEYNYLSFGQFASLASDGTSMLANKTNLSLVKVGLNYRLGLLSPK